ncbi:hypothetical protein, partial [Burkholderia paludis]
DALTAAYAGDTNNLGSVADTGPTVQVAAASGAPQPPALTDGTVRFSMRVPLPDGQQIGFPVALTPYVFSDSTTGTFSVFDGQTLVASFTNPDEEQQYLSPMSLGTHDLTVVYSGDSETPAGTGTTQVTVGQAAGTVALSTSTSQATVGVPLTLTATVGASQHDESWYGVPFSGPSATGTVTFYSNGTAIGTA